MNETQIEIQVQQAPFGAEFLSTAAVTLYGCLACGDRQPTQAELEAYAEMYFKK